MVGLVFLQWWCLGGVPAVVMFGWGSCGGFSLLPPCSSLSSAIVFFFFFFNSFKSNYLVWVSSFWMVKNSDMVCSYWRV